ncbi:hypothetical protein R1sor_022599 [Riccia sorocarpa]|uniref:Thymidylate kinase n=1 Tax=Riccia sorocarpa TaxID=122646 RepID=A0ABD3GL08_9MARC
MGFSILHRAGLSVMATRGAAVKVAVEKRGALIVLEGLDRSGKSSQCRALASFLRERGESVEEWRFPDRTTAIGQMISSYLSQTAELDDSAIHLLFAANRWEKKSSMESTLRNGTTLLVDRYSYSGVAFSAAKGLDFQWCSTSETALPAADLVLFLDIDPEVAARRGEYGLERYEEVDFQRRVATYYQAMRDSTWQIVDANQSVEEVQEALREAAVSVIQSCKSGAELLRLWPTANKISD